MCRCFSNSMVIKLFSLENFKIKMILNVAEVEMEE